MTFLHFVQKKQRLIYFLITKANGGANVWNCFLIFNGSVPGCYISLNPSSHLYLSCKAKCSETLPICGAHHVSSYIEHPVMVQLIPVQSVPRDLLDIHGISIDCAGLTETQQKAFIWLMYIPSLMLHCDVNNVLFLPYSNLIDSQAFWALQRAIVVVNAVTIGFHIGWGLRKVQCPFSDIKPGIVYQLRAG